MIQYSSDMMLAEYDIECASYAYESTMVDMTLGEADQSSIDTALEAVKKTNESWFVKLKNRVKDFVKKIGAAVKKLLDRIVAFFTKRKIKSDVKKLDKNTKKMIAAGAAGAAVILVPAGIALFLQRRRIGEYKNALEDLARSKDAIIDRFNETENAYREKQIENQRLRDKNVDLKSLARELRDKLDVEEKRSDDAIDDLFDARKRADDAESSNSFLRMDVDKLTAEVKRLEGELDEKHAQIRSFKKQKSDDDYTIHEYKDDLEFANKQYSDLKWERDRIARELKQAKADLKQAISDKQKAESDRDYSNTANAKKIDSLTSRLKSAENESFDAHEKYIKAASILSTLAQIVSDSPLNDSASAKNTSNDPKFVEMVASEFSACAKNINADAQGIFNLIDKYGYKNSHDVDPKAFQNVADGTAEEHKRRAFSKIVENATQDLRDKIRVANGVLQANEIAQS